MTLLTALFRILLVSCSAVRIVSAVFSMAVAGCTVGPDFEVPKPPSVSRYTSSGEATVPDPDIGRGVPAQGRALGGRVAADWGILFRSSALHILIKERTGASYHL